MYKAELQVDRQSIELNRFAEQFLAQTVTGAASSLKGTENITDMHLSVKEEQVSLKVNGKEITLTEFPEKIICGTVKGLVGSLKGVDQAKDIEIQVKA